MALRKISMGISAGTALLSLALVSVASAQGPAAGRKASAELIPQAERILIGSPEEDVDVAGDEPFLVEIIDVVRGTGTKGKLARLFNSGDAKQHPRFKKGQVYVFLLKKKAGTPPGWSNLSLSEIPIEDGKVLFSGDGKAKESLSLAEFRDLVAGGGRETIAGKWMVTLSEDGDDSPFWLVDVVRDAKGAYKAALVESAPNAMSASMLKGATVSEQDIQLEFLADGHTFDFRGKFDKGSVRGSMAVDSDMVAPARLIATELASIPKTSKPVPSAGKDDFIEAMQGDAKAKFDGLMKFVDNHGDSPLALDAYEGLVMLARTNGYDQEQVRKLGAAYLQASGRWGQRLELKSLVELGVMLSRSETFPELALEYLNAADKKLTDETPAHWKFMVRVEIGKRLFQGDKPAEGLVILRKLHDENPFEPQITWLLARQAEQEKDTDAAIKLYGQLAGLPMLEPMLMQSLARGGKKVSQDDLPSRILQRLWSVKHGDTKGLPDFLSEVYDTTLHALASPKQAPRKEGQGTRVVLCELFTGSACPPCVGADAATTVLEATYAPSEVIVLRYHQHSPSPDPLANEETEERFLSYDGEGTPTVRVNGKSFEGAGGFMPQVPGIYRRLRESIDPYLIEKTGLKFELSAKAERGRVAISAKALGLKTFPKDMRLKLVLAEDKVTFMAPNGIRSHEMLVRAMPGGVDGIEPDKGQLAWSGEVDLAKLKADLTKYLAAIEFKMKEEFEQKPFEFKALHLVAFLQNDDTDEILQAASIPVAGLLGLPEESAKPAPAPAKRAAEPAAKASKANVPPAAKK